MSISLNRLNQSYQSNVNSDYDATHQYFNMGVFNEFTPNNTQPQTVIFNQVKQFNIVDKADDYYLSIIRWNLQSNLPVLIPDIQIKSNKSIFSGLTDYQLSFLYSTESEVPVSNTFGLVSLAGNNYNGIYNNQSFGLQKELLINYPPDSSSSVAYDNFENGSGGVGSIYIISDGVLKIFDKISLVLLATFTPVAGTYYKFVTTNKTTGYFYISLSATGGDVIEYAEGTRTGIDTWNLVTSIGSTYTSVSLAPDVGGIAYVSNTLNELASSTIFSNYISVSNLTIDTLSSLVPWDIIEQNSPVEGTYLKVSSDSLNGLATIYMSDYDGATASNVYAYQGGSATSVQTFTPSPTYAGGYTLLTINTLCTDTSGNLYVACEYINGLSFLGIVYSYKRNSASVWTIDDTYVIVPAGANPTSIQSNQTILVYDGQLIVYLANSDGEQYFQFLLVDQVQFNTGASGFTNWRAITDSQYIYRCSSSGVLQIGNLMGYTYQYSGFYIDRFLGFDSANHLLIHRVQSNFTTPIGYQAINISDGSIAYTFTPSINGSYVIALNNSSTPTNISNTTNTINQWSAFGAPSNTQIITSTNIAPTNLLKSSLIADDTYLYALTNNINNTDITKVDPSSLNTINSYTSNLSIKNGLVGFDNSGNLLLSISLVGSAGSLTAFNSSLVRIYTIADPLIVNASPASSTYLMYPFTELMTQTIYNTAGNECTNLIFIPETINTNYSSLLNYPQDKEQLFSNPYFYIKYVDTFCRMFNNAIKSNFSDISGNWDHLPYIQWDSQNGKLVFNQPTSQPTGTIAPAGSLWFIAVNQPLYNLLSTFRFKYFPINSGNGSLYPESLNCRYLLDTNILFDNQSEPAGEYVSYLQQISSVQTWTPIQSLVFKSVIMPIEPQLTGQPQNLNIIEPTTNGSVYKQQNLTKTMTDFIVPLTTGVELCNQIIDFANSGEYRLVDLLGQNGLNQLSLEVDWKDKYGVLHPLTIDAGANADLLCMLRKKSYNN
tara:strand:- start:138 stop:3137 length:3000 start_codon:yes stop_codon:yes gene_type:complete